MIRRHLVQQFLYGHRGERAGRIGHGVGEDQKAAVNQRAATVDDVRHITFPLRFVGAQQRSRQPADHAGRIFQIEQEGPDGVFAHRADTMTDDEPARLRLDGRTAVADLQELPAVGRLQERHLGMPEVQIVRVHEVEILGILS